MAQSRIFPRIWMILPRIVVSASHVDVNEISNFNLRGRIVLIVYGREAKLFAITVDYLFNYLHYIPARARARATPLLLVRQIMLHTDEPYSGLSFLPRQPRGGCVH